MMETFYKDFIDLLGSKPEIAVSCFILGAIFWGMIIRRENNFFKLQTEIIKKQLDEALNTNRKYEIEDLDIKINTLYEVTKISNAIMLEIPKKYKELRILASYSKPSNIQEIEDMCDAGKKLNDELVILNDIPKYIYLKYDGNSELDHIKGKGLSVKLIKF